MNDTMQTMAATMMPNKNHADILGNPSTATSSKVKLRTSLDDGQPLRVFSESDWQFWRENGYVVVKNAVPREQALATAAFLWEFEDKLVKVKMEAGDMLIFNSSQPHGIRANNSTDKVRIAQYISMMPAEEDNADLRDWRINSWKNRIAPEGYAFPGDPRNWEKTNYDTAELNDLGKKLLGLEKF
jgi:hypothetical protein